MTYLWDCIILNILGLLPKLSAHCFALPVVGNNTYTAMTEELPHGLPGSVLPGRFGALANYTFVIRKPPTFVTDAHYSVVEDMNKKFPVEFLTSGALDELGRSVDPELVHTSAAFPRRGLVTRVILVSCGECRGVAVVFVRILLEHKVLRVVLLRLLLLLLLWGGATAFLISCILPCHKFVVCETAGIAGDLFSVIGQT